MKIRNGKSIGNWAGSWQNSTGYGACTVTIRIAIRAHPMITGITGAFACPIQTRKEMISGKSTSGQPVKKNSKKVYQTVNSGID
jgi:hypothetical protein